MKELKISTAQFENKNGDKEYNLSVIEKLAGQAAEDNSEVVAFHECSVTGYTFARNLSREDLLSISELIPEGGSVKRLKQIAEKCSIIILAGLFEKDLNGRIYKTYVCVGRNGLIARHRKLHPFINPNITEGDSYTIFDINGWKCGILICYDNNII